MTEINEHDKISAKGGTIALIGHCHSLVSEEEADANAKLIAAAPELLDICKRATQLECDCENSPLPCLKCLAIHALAKAEVSNG